MSDVSVGFVFSTAFAHSITCLIPYNKLIITGSFTGELILWLPQGAWQAGMVCCAPEDISCLSLSLISPLPELKALFTTEMLVVALYSRSKLRVWDVADGKCIAYSGDLFSEKCQLAHLTHTTRNEVLTAGKDKIFLLDCYRMLTLRVFQTDSVVVGVIAVDTRVFAQSGCRVYCFDTQDAFDSQQSQVEHAITEDYPTCIIHDKKSILVSNRNEIAVIHISGQKLSPADIRSIRITQVIHSLHLFQEKFLVLSGKTVFHYNKSEVLDYSSGPKCLPPHEQTDLNFEPISTYMHYKRLYGFSSNKISILNLNTCTVEPLTISLPGNKELMIDEDHRITARNLFVVNEILLAVGTDHGKVIVSSISSEVRLIYFKLRCAVTAIYLHNDILAVAYSNESLLFWEFNLRAGVFYHTEPLKSIEVWTSHIVNILPFSYSKRNINFSNEMSWKNSKYLWKDILLGQCESGAVLLIDFQAKTVLSYFQALKSFVTKAVMFLNLEYIALHCANSRVYVFNMTMLTLEREISGTRTLDYQNFFSISEKKSRYIDRNDKVSLCFEFFFNEYCKKGMDVRFIVVGSSYFPVLLVNFTYLTQKNDPRITGLKTIIESEQCRQAMLSSGQAVSFKYNCFDSRHMNSMKLAAMVSMSLDSPLLQYNTVALIIYSLNPSSNMRHKLLQFSVCSPEMISVARAILKPASESSPKKIRRSVDNTLNKFVIDKFHSQRAYSSLLEVIAISILACSSITQVITYPGLIDLLIKLLKSTDEGFILLACEFLIKGKDVFRDHFKPPQVEEITKELLLSSCRSSPNSTPESFFKVITCVGLSHVSFFINTLRTELKNSISASYPLKILYTMEFFVLHHFQESTSVLEELGDFLLKANKLQSKKSSPEFTDDFVSVIQSFASLLPMVALSPGRRFLILGMPTGSLRVYDLRSHKRWKLCQVFDTTISALAYREGLIVCYSSQECCLKSIKADQGLFGGGELKLTGRLLLPEIEPVAASYQELIKTIRLRWTSAKTLSILRENRTEYPIYLNNFN